MGSVHDGGVAQLLELLDCEHVADESIIAETCAAFDEGDFVVSQCGDFVDDVFHVPGGEELGLFYLYTFSGTGGCFDQVGLADKKGGQLDDVENLCGDLGLIGQMDVGDDRQGEFATDVLKDAESLLDAGPAETGAAGAVGLVEAGFEDIADAEPGCEGLELLGNAKAEVATLDDAWAGNKKQAGVGADGDCSDVRGSNLQSFHGRV